MCSSSESGVSAYPDPADSFVGPSSGSASGSAGLNTGESTGTGLLVTVDWRFAFEDCLDASDDCLDAVVLGGLGRDPSSESSVSADLDEKDVCGGASESSGIDGVSLLASRAETGVEDLLVIGEAAVGGFSSASSSFGSSFGD